MTTPRTTGSTRAEDAGIYGSHRGGGGSASRQGGSATLDSQGENFVGNGPLLAEPTAVKQAPVPVPPSAAFTLVTTEKKEGGAQDSACVEDEGQKKEGAAEDGALLVSEAEASKGYGLSRAAMGLIRRKHMVEGEHWQMQGRAVMLTPQGRELLANLVGVQGGEKDAPPGYTLTITKIPRNPRLLVCTGSAGSISQRGDLRVRVRNNAGFRPGMVLEGCRAVDLQHDHFEFRGKPPRHRRAAR